MNRKRTLGLAPAEFRVRNRAASAGSDNDGSTLSLDFTSGILDPRLDFTRGSNATFINSSGLVQYADANMITGSELLQPGLYQWNAQNGATQFFDPTVVNPSGSFGASQLIASTDTGSSAINSSPVSVIAGFTYTLTFYVRAGNSSSILVGLYETAAFAPATATILSGSGSISGTGAIAITGLSNSAWTRVRMYITPTITSTNRLISFYPDNARAGGLFVYVWGAQFNIGQIAAPGYFKTVSAAYYAPRFDYNPTTLTSRGLLMEGTATNILTYSQFAYTGSNPPTGWTSPFTGGPGSVATSTYGTLDGANAWTQTASANRPMLSSTAMTLTSGSTYTASMYLESVSGGLTYQDVLLVLAGTGTSLGSPVYRRNGVTVSAGDTAQVGRIEATVSCTGSGTANLRCGPGSNANCTGSATFSRPQVEVGVQASSYIPTQASTVARTKDEMTMANISALGFNPRGGTVFMQLDENPRDYETYPYFASFEQSPSGRGWCFARFSNFVSVGRRVFGIAFKTNASTLIASSGATRPAGQYKFAQTLDTALARMAIVVNGGAAVVNADTVATMATIGSLKFNNTTETGPTEFSSVWIAQLKYWPIVFPNEFLRNITT